MCNTLSNYALGQIAETGNEPTKQLANMGCPIKWQ